MVEEGYLSSKVSTIETSTYPIVIFIAFEIICPSQSRFYDLSL